MTRTPCGSPKRRASARAEKLFVLSRCFLAVSSSATRTSLQHNCAVFFFTRASGMLAIIVVLICSLPAAVSACGFVRLCARVFSRKTPRSLRTPLPHLISPAQTVHQVIAKRAVSYFYQGGYHAGSPRDYASILASQSGALLAGAPYPGARLARSRLVVGCRRFFRPPSPRAHRQTTCTNAGPITTTANTHTGQLSKAMPRITSALLVLASGTTPRKRWWHSSTVSSRTI